MAHYTETSLNEITKVINNNRSLENTKSNISNSLIIGLSILTIGALTSTALNGLNRLHFGHNAQKYEMELNQIEKQGDLLDLIRENNKIISFYRWSFNLTFGIGVATVVFVTRNSINALRP